ncbi:hypothetical protein [Pseudoroseomonas cervicalis]|uniref:hypothetical protein n=1 Tax=Teichococcus cervicalis TaxID=204525 RepID=UPI00278801B1|nr:hypothetical protein [Pseudoroseomonas cervicalis]MDQ1078435.1 hypothetical protein [Pseudoroseomonas cervicalis]
MSGEAAFARLRDLARRPVFETVIDRLNFGEQGGYDRTSCAMNSTAVVKTATRQTIAAGSTQAGAITGLSPLPPQGMTGGHTAAVMQALQQPVILAFQLQLRRGETGSAGDHYFSAFRLDARHIIVSMGWQGLYDFPTWFAENEGGRFEQGRFEALMRQIEDGEVEGLAGLCSFLGTTPRGAGIPATLQRELAGCRPVFRPTYQLRLPRG